MREKLARTLYLCYFGLREPLVQTQVCGWGAAKSMCDLLEFSLKNSTPIQTNAFVDCN